MSAGVFLSVLLPDSELNQVSFRPSIFPFLLFFKRGSVSATPGLTSPPLFSIFLWDLPLYLLLSLITSSVFSLLLTSFRLHMHALRCPVLPEKPPSLLSHHASLEGTAHTALLRFPSTPLFLLIPSVPNGAQAAEDQSAGLPFTLSSIPLMAFGALVKAEGSAGTRRWQFKKCSSLSGHSFW